uniref:Uncharacterized protein n=1 Tax=Arundo donax TaxID=35708 RepID=A0A0A9BS17_ARUDO
MVISCISSSFIRVIGINPSSEMRVCKLNSLKFWNLCHYSVLS